MGIENQMRLDGRHRKHRLITPHGDRKRTIAACLPSGNKPSLPLMGIENAERMTVEEIRGDSSLPLMGIENNGVRAAAVVSSMNSLPLMGIENDTDAPPPPWNTGSSLPLMGIENPNELTDPHGV